jgi:GNAT superfamily N-acetyltransferase
MTSPKRLQTGVRAATAADLGAIAAIAMATGQDEDWDEVFPAYIGHLMAYGTLLVAERGGTVTGFGATLGIGSGERAVSMLTDLFVHPDAHGTGAGRAILGTLWTDEPRRMTFSSLDSRALPLYTSFGMDAWWPLLYLRGDGRQLPMPPGWSVSPAEPATVAALEAEWTGIDRTAEHRMWAARPNGSAVLASIEGRTLAAGTVGGAGPEYGISHLAVAAGQGAHDANDANDANDGSDGSDARDAVLAVLSWLDPAAGQARVCLPAPHPATRPLLRAGWQIEEFDLHMASEFGLLDPRSLVPSPALA